MDSLGFDELKQLAADGDANAQFMLGERFEQGRGGAPLDVRHAAWWYRLAANQGHATALCNLGMMYASGSGVAQDDAEAVKLYRQAAEQGDPEAQFLLGMAYGLGRGVQRNVEESRRWYKKMMEPPPAAGGGGGTGAG